MALPGHHVRKQGREVEYEGAGPTWQRKQVARTHELGYARSWAEKWAGLRKIRAA